MIKCPPCVTARILRAVAMTIVLSVLSPVGASAQIEHVGTSTTLDVATWNIEWFGHPGLDPADDDQQVANVADIMLGTGIDIWALQEITDNARFEELLTQLGPDWAGLLGSIPAFNRTQRLAYVWNTQVTSLRQSTHILQSSDFYFAGRPPLKATFDVTIEGEALRLTLINVHMKAGGDQDDYERRLVAAARVKVHIDFTALDTEPVLFIGDFNDELEASIYRRNESPYAPFLEDSDGFSALSLPLEQAGLATHLGGSTLDHIVASNEMVDRYIPSSMDRMASLLSVNGFGSRTSDHLPVFASFSLTALPVGLEPLPETSAAPGDPNTLSLFPNPASARLTLELASIGQSEARVLVYDVLGRAVLEPIILPPAQTNLSLDVTGLAPGVYFVRTERDGQSRTARFVLGR